MRIGRIATLLIALTVAGGALAGPVVTYRDGPEFCPRDRPDGAPVLTEAQVIARARTLLPKDFCGPNRWVTGCDFDPELIRESWRVFIEQYDDRSGVKDHRGLEHNYVILDRVGNCYANIPGTVLGSPN